MPRSLPLTAHLPRRRHTTPLLGEASLPASETDFFHVMAQQLEVRQEFKHSLIRSLGHQTRIWELWVLPQKRPFNPTGAPLPPWEAALKPAQQIAWDLSERCVWQTPSSSSRHHCKPNWVRFRHAALQKSRESGLEEQQGISHGLCSTFDLPYFFIGPLDFNSDRNLFSGHKEVCCSS